MNHKSILFVCMGNICRSPAAEGVMRHVLTEAGLDKEIKVDSAGTIDYHIGKAPDSRMTRAAAQRGVTLDHKARQVKPDDLEKFDLILVMDQENYTNVKRLDHEGKYSKKIQLFCDYCTEHDAKVVPDPYYGGAEGFEEVLNLLEDGCAEITRRLKTQASTHSQG